MGNCISQKKNNPSILKEITENNNKNNIEEQDIFVKNYFEKVDNNLINLYGKKLIIDSIKYHWWFLKTNMEYDDELVKKINSKIFI